MALRTGETYRHIDTLPREENGDVGRLQERLTQFVATRLEEPKVRASVLGILQDAQDQSLHLQNPQTGQKTPIEVSLLPIVISNETEQKLETLTQVGNLVRSATLMKINEDPDLQAFFESGVHPLTTEIMQANPYAPAKNQWRFRADTATDQTKGTMKAIENNGGEPQGDGIVSDSIRVVEKVLGVCLDIPDDQQVELSDYPDEQMMQVMVGRYQEVTGTQDLPTIGYFAWRGRSSLSQAEANYTAKRYREQYGKNSIQFDPTDIVDIKKKTSDAGKPYYVLVCETEGVDGESVQTEIDMVRRLHGEPMENIDLWQNFKDTSGQNICSDGEETIWDRFVTKMGNQMINPLNSYATDKKLDVILGNPAYLEHFGIWDKVEEIAANEEISETLALTKQTREMVKNGSIKDFMAETFPLAHMVRRTEDGLYEGDTQANDLGLSSEQIADIQNNRNNWVLKRASLVGHSGTSVHVGSNPLLHELDFEDYMILSERELEAVSGLTRREFEGRWINGGLTQIEDPKAGEKDIRAKIIEQVAQLPDTEKEALQDSAWRALIENSLNTPDSLVQQAVAQTDVPTILFEKIDGEMIPVRRDMHCDIDPQSIGPTRYTYPVIRVTSATKTNITGGYGGLGVPISEDMARSMLEYANHI